MNIVKKGIKLALVLGVSLATFGSKALAAQTGDSVDKSLKDTFGTGLLGSTISVPSLVALSFQIVLAGAIVYSVAHLLKSGYKITGAGAEAEKRTEGFKGMLNSVLGLMVAFSSYGIVNTVKNQLIGNDAKTTLEFPCSGVNPTTTQKETGNTVGKECLSVLNENADGTPVKLTTPTPTPEDPT